MAVNDWSVLVEARSETETIEIDDARIALFMHALEGHFGVVSAAGPAWSARITVDASSPTGAIESAVASVSAAAASASMPQWPYVRVEAVRDDELDREIAESWPNLERRGQGAKPTRIIGGSGSSGWSDMMQPAVT